MTTNPQQTWQVRLVAGLLLGLLCAALVGTARQFGWTEFVERITLDRLFRARGPQFPSPDIVTVVADDATVAQAKGWPLPRRMYGEVIRRLHRAGARTIAFDIAFSKDSPSGRDDALLAKALADSRSVVSAAIFQLRTDPRQSTSLDIPGDTAAPSPRFAIGGNAVPSLEAVRGVGPLEKLQQASPALGHINAIPDSDGILRRISHLIEFDGDAFPSLALASTAHFLGINSDQVEVRNGAIQLQSPTGSFNIPVNEKGEVLVNWIGDTRSFPTFTFEQVLSGAVPESTLQGRIVLVGVTASAAFDHRASPFSASQPAVEVQANAINDILQRRILRTVAPAAQWAILLLVALACGGVMVQVNAWKSLLGAAVALLALWVGAVLLLSINWYFPVAAPLLVVLLTLAASVSYRQISDARNLRLAQERYALAVEGAKDGLWDWDLVTDHLYLSPRWQEMVGFGAELEQKPATWLDRVHAEDKEQLQADLQSHREGHTPHLENEHRIQHRDGSYRWVLCRGLAVRTARGKAVRMAGSMTDVTDRRAEEQQARFDALHDSLTGLPNRTFLLNLLEHAVQSNNRLPENDLALFFLDVDQFKFVNDRLGHIVGDRLLVQVADRLRSNLQPGSTAVRLRGDEFAVLLEATIDVAESSRVAQRLIEVLSHPYRLGDEDMLVSASIGIVHQISTYSRAENVLRDGEIAMYRAKSAGRSRYEIFDAGMHQQIVSRIQLETELRQALERQQFLLHYQPIVSLLTGRIAGFEALVRWQHPDGHLVPPGAFIPLAEETGLIVEMDLWSLQEACRQLREWHQQEPAAEEEPLFISVNLSRKLFSMPNLVARVASVLETTKLEARHLKLEITESAIVENTDSATKTLNELKSLGLQLSIDDFGTGYSSLSYLHHFPLDVLKIDRSFVDQIETNEGKYKIVWTIIAMARNMEMQVVAEGVETDEQRELLRTLTCDYTQGYFFSRPLPWQEAEALLRSQPCWLSEMEMAAVDRHRSNPH